MAVPARKRSSGMSRFFDEEPFRALREEMDDLLGRFSADWDGGLLGEAALAPIDLSETEDALQARMDMPGIKPDEIEIEVAGNQLRVRGERKEEHEEKGKTWHRVERRTGSYARSIMLPCAIDEDKVEAEYHDGVLTINMPKTEEAKTHKVKVKG